MPKNQCVIELGQNIKLDTAKYLVKYVWVVGHFKKMCKSGSEARTISHIDKIEVPEEQKKKQVKKAQ